MSEKVEVVIEIPKYYLTHPQDYTCLAECVRRGTILPKAHGRLIDGDRTLATAWTNFYKHEDEWEKKDDNYLPFGRMYEQNGFEYCQQTIVNAPTIIEADKEDNE